MMQESHDFKLATPGRRVGCSIASTVHCRRAVPHADTTSATATLVLLVTRRCP